jgi:hypothetical protein
MPTLKRSSKRRKTIPRPTVCDLAL